MNFPRVGLGRALVACIRPPPAAAVAWRPDDQRDRAVGSRGRTGEAIALSDGAADLFAGMLTVWDSKWHKPRQAPIHPTVAGLPR